MGSRAFWWVTHFSLALIPGVSLAASENYTPPTSADSLDILVGKPVDNGYGLGALIASQQENDGGNQNAESHSSDNITTKRAVPHTAAAREARRVAEFRRKAQELEIHVTQLQTEKSAQDKAITRLRAKLSAAENAVRHAVQTVEPAELIKLREQVDVMLRKETLLTEKMALAESTLNERGREIQLKDKALTALQERLSLTGEREKELIASKAAIKLGEQQQATLKMQVDKLTVQLAEARVTDTDLKNKLVEAQANIKKMVARTTEPSLPLDSSASKQAYVVGQSIASSLRTRLSSYTASGVSLSRDVVLKGISDGLSGTMKLSKEEMDSAYRQFAAYLQKQIAGKVADAQRQLALAVKGQKVTKSVDGMHYVVVKKGQIIADPDLAVSLAITEKIASNGQMISQIPRLTLSQEDDMPSVIREALPLLGVGAEVKAWAMARNVYGSRSLPNGVEPYTVLIYDLRGLESEKADLKHKAN